MLQPSIKQRVRESFDRAAVTYDGAAVVQRTVCERLLAELERPAAAPPAHILDAGCGTGYGAQLLRRCWPAAHITGVDFAPAMLARAQHAADACYASDIEKLPFSDARFNLWWSSLTIQWCDTGKVFAEARRVLKPGGQLALSTLGPDTFHELRTAFSGIDQYRHTLPFSEEDDIATALTAAQFSKVTVRRECQRVYYPDLKSLLRSIKAIGAQNVGEGGRSGMLGRAAWQKLEATYEQFREPAGLPASYDVLLCYAKK